MKLLHVTFSISPKSGGPTRSVKGLCRSLSCAGQDVTLLIMTGNDEFENPCGVKVIRALPTSLSSFDLVHLHGIWSPCLHNVATRCRTEGVPYIISPRGMLDPWALSVKKWKKVVAMLLYQRRDLLYAAGFHATAEVEAHNIKCQGLKQRIIVAPNGVDVPTRMPSGEKYRVAGLHTAIFMSRLHPGKGLLILADAWARLRPSGWRMVVVGPDSYGHKNDVVAKLTALGIKEQWQFVDIVGDEEKWEYYKGADLLVHPSVSENFGITIAEGLSAGLPVICTKGTPWSSIPKCKAGWWIDTGIEPLAKALEEAISLSDDERRRMGVNGQRLVEEKYTWAAVVRAMQRGYEEIVPGK